MRKDLLRLRESDALKERDKIAKIRTLQELLEDKKTQLQKEAQERQKAQKMEEVLTRGEKEERLAEKDLRKYATEQERQQIFLLESQRLGFEREIDLIDKEKDPALKLEKNNLLLKRRDFEAKLSVVEAQEKKIEAEQHLVQEKSETTTIVPERKGLEQRRGDLEKDLEEIEKKRWAVEKDIEAIDSKISQIEKSSDLLTTQKNELRNKALGADKQLRDIYSVVMQREEEKRRGLEKEEVARKEELSQARAVKNEAVQRQQWSGKTGLVVPVPTKRPAVKSFEKEEEARKKFLQDIETATNKNTIPK